MKRLTLILAALVIAAPAFAADAARAPAIIPYGDLLRDAMLALGASASVLIAWGLRALPKHIQFLIVQMRIDRMLTAAITSAINRTAGAQAGKALSLDLGNAVATRAGEDVAGRAAQGCWRHPAPARDDPGAPLSR
jgi:hypothetical protein